MGGFRNGVIADGIVIAVEHTGHRLQEVPSLSMDALDSAIAGHLP
jgi:hypothetical protein